jgi:hypothetical protein
MSHLSRKIIAVLMLLWLPLFIGNALAAMVSMQMQQGKCHETPGARMMSHDSMGEHHMNLGKTPATTDEHSPSCSAGGVCHLACTGFLAAPSQSLVTIQIASSETILFLVAFRSFTSTPLVPPPHVHA